MGDEFVVDDFRQVVISALVEVMQEPLVERNIR
jgi:hypothetical protein